MALFFLFSCASSSCQIYLYTVFVLFILYIYIVLLRMCWDNKKFVFSNSSVLV